MFGYDSLIDIRNFESFIFEGPEVAEQVFETNDNFVIAKPLRKRAQGVGSSNAKFSGDAVYICSYNESDDEMKYEICNR